MVFARQPLFLGFGVPGVAAVLDDGLGPESYYTSNFPHNRQTYPRDRTAIDETSFLKGC